MEILMGVLDNFIEPYLWITGVLVLFFIGAMPMMVFFEILKEGGFINTKEDLEKLKKNKYIKMGVLFWGKCLFKVLIIILKTPFWPILILYRVIKFIFK